MEKQELAYFKKVVDTIDSNMTTTQKAVEGDEKALEEKKKVLADNYYEISKGDELSSYFSTLEILEGKSIEGRTQLKHLLAQRRNPYFSRIDFKTDDVTQKVYIGINGLRDNDGSMLVYDWRAPISSMYYDFTLGKASYLADKTLYSGEITLKRQYKVDDGELLSYFDTSLTIDDDILQEVLSKNSSAKMRQIVSTIQKEQNIIVRTEEFDNLLVQGVAGSGKTSIALHRAAYLLYRHRNTLTSKDILIMSPNNIFSSYISEVLPQLGEDNLVETSYDQIARIELHESFETREEMLDRLATKPTQQELNEISLKASFEYLGELLKFLRGDFLNTFSPKTLKFNIGTRINKDMEEEKVEEVFDDGQTSKLFFDTFKNLTIAERINKIAWQYAMVFTEKRGYNKEQNRGLRDRFKSILYNFLPLKDVKKVFDIFLSRMNLTPRTEPLGYMDKGAMLLIKHFIYGFEHDFSAKYLIIDEMQDFTPVDLYVFKKLWSCPSIVLGDINQCIEKNLSRDYLMQVSDYLGTELIELKKTYRSTKEIAQFAHEMIGIKDVQYVNRSGDAPRLINSKNVSGTIKHLIEEECVGFEHVAIICKCQNEVKQLAKELKGIDFKILDEPEDYNNKVILTTCATAKGIEFDCVIVPNATEKNYNNALDKNILYVSSTRALHKLFFIANDTPTKFLSKLK